MKELLAPAPHPYKAAFRQLGISQLKLCYNLKLTQAYLNHVLNGYIPMPPKMYQEMSELIHHLKDRKKH